MLSPSAFSTALLDLPPSTSRSSVLRVAMGVTVPEAATRLVAPIRSASPIRSAGPIGYSTPISSGYFGWPPTKTVTSTSGCRLRR